MKSFEFTFPARQDLENIWDYIALDSPAYADKVRDAILENARTLASMPHAGKPLEASARRFVRGWVVTPYRNYLIVYEPDTRPVRVVAILHGARDIETLLR